MKPTSRYNADIRKTLDGAGIAYKDYGGQIWVNRDSMCRTFDKPGRIPEEYAYPETLSLIRAALPKGVYSTWGFKNDDEIMLEVDE